MRNGSREVRTQEQNFGNETQNHPKPRQASDTTTHLPLAPPLRREERREKLRKAVHEAHLALVVRELVVHVREQAVRRALHHLEKHR